MEAKKLREVSVENKFVRSLLYGLALERSLTSDDITRIVNNGVERVDEMTEEDKDRLLRQVPKVVKLFGSPPPLPVGVVTTVQDHPIYKAIAHLMDTEYLPRIKESPGPRFYMKRFQDHIILITGTFYIGEDKLVLNGSVNASRSISNLDKNLMATFEGKRINVVRDLSNLGPFRKLIIWGWAIKITNDSHCRLWINKQGTGDIATYKVRFNLSLPAGFERVTFCTLTT